MLISRGNYTLGDDTHFPCWVAVFGSDGLVFPETRALAEYRGDTGSWLLALTSGSYLEGRDISLKVMCSRGGHWLLASGPTFARTVNNVDAKYVDTDAFGGRVTCTANVTIRLMGPMVSLALPRSSRLTENRGGRFSQIY